MGSYERLANFFSEESRPARIHNDNLFGLPFWIAQEPRFLRLLGLKSHWMFSSGTMIFTFVGKFGRLLDTESQVFSSCFSCVSSDFFAWPAYCHSVIGKENLKKDGSVGKYSFVDVCSET